MAVVSVERVTKKGSWHRLGGGGHATSTQQSAEHSPLLSSTAGSGGANGEMADALPPLPRHALVRRAAVSTSAPTSTTHRTLHSVLYIFALASALWVAQLCLPGKAVQVDIRLTLG